MSLLINTIKQVAEKYLAHRQVAFVMVFGSQATGNADGQSDLDIAIGFSNQNLSDEEKFKIIDELGSKLATILRIPFEQIDIKIFETLPLTLRFRVIQQGKAVFVKDLPDFRKKAISTVAMYQDEKPFFDLATKAFFRRNAINV